MASGTSTSRPDVTESITSQFGRLETAGKQTAHHLVGEELHATVRVMNDEPLLGSEQA